MVFAKLVRLIIICFLFYPGFVFADGLGNHIIDKPLTFSYTNTDVVDCDTVPIYEVYENEVATPILTGSMAKLNDSGTNGNYSEQITLSTANGFEVGKSYRALMKCSQAQTELVTNGTFDADTDWTKGTGWTIGSGVASSDGTQTGDSLLTTSTVPATVSGTEYVVEFEVTSYTSGNVALQFDGVEVIADKAATGTYRTTAIASDTTGTIDVVADLDFVGSVDNVVLKKINRQVTDTWNVIADPLTQTEVTGGAYPLDTDANGRMRIVDGTGAGEIDTLNGSIVNVDLVDTTTTNTDMRGTDSAILASSAPTNFGDLAITATTGQVTVGTNNDKTGYTLTTGEQDLIVDKVWDEPQSGHVTAGTFGLYLDAQLTLRSKAAADYFDWTTDLVTLAAVTHTGAVIPTVSTLTGHTPQTGDTYSLANGANGFVAIKADTSATLGDTNELQVDWTNGGRLDLILDDILADTADIQPKIGAPANTDLATDISSVQADTDNIQQRLPGALVNGRMDSDVGFIQPNVINLSAIDDTVEQDVLGYWGKFTVKSTNTSKFKIPFDDTDIVTQNNQLTNDNWVLCINNECAPIRLTTNDAGGDIVDVDPYYSFSVAPAGVTGIIKQK